MASSDHPDQPDRYVQLKNGLVLPVEAVRLALALEERGFTLQREDDDTLSAQPYERLTPADFAAIRRWKWHLLAVVDYVADTAPAVLRCVAID